MICSPLFACCAPAVPDSATTSAEAATGNVNKSACLPEMSFTGVSGSCWQKAEYLMLPDGPNGDVSIGFGLSALAFGRIGREQPIRRDGGRWSVVVSHPPKAKSQEPRAESPSESREPEREPTHS